MRYRTPGRLVPLAQVLILPSLDEIRDAVRTKANCNWYIASLTESRLLQDAFLRQHCFASRDCAAMRAARVGAREGLADLASRFKL